MKSFKNLSIALAIAAIVVSVVHLRAQQVQPNATSDEVGVHMVVEGLVRDVACPMQNHKSTATHFNLRCAMACAKSGSPLIILAKDDHIYFPMSDQMPDPSQRERLMPFVGKYVHVTGIVYERNGTRSIVIKDITEMIDVKLMTHLGDD